MVPLGDFLFGTEWSPQTAIRADQAGSSGAFGSVPLFWGTIFIGAIIAMIVAIPLGLMSAIYLTQYAHAAGALVDEADARDPRGRADRRLRLFRCADGRPVVRDLGMSIGITSASSESALAAGLVMGIMIIPFISSMADDSIAAVPQAMRDGIAGDGRDQVRNDPQGRSFRPRCPAWSAACCSRSAARSARR